MKINSTPPRFNTRAFQDLTPELLLALLSCSFLFICLLLSCATSVCEGSMYAYENQLSDLGNFWKKNQHSITKERSLCPWFEEAKYNVFSFPFSWGHTLWFSVPFWFLHSLQAGFFSLRSEESQYNSSKPTFGRLPVPPIWEEGLWNSSKGLFAIYQPVWRIF